MAAKGQKEKMDVYKKAFQDADKSGDGKLDVMEFRTMLKKNGCNLSDQQIADTFLFFSEKDNDKKNITFEEFCEGLDKLQQFQSKLRQLFEQLDEDKSGFLDRKELRKLMEMAGMKLDDKELEEILRRADTNRDDKISYDEFVEAVC